MSIRWTAPTGPGDTETELPALGAVVGDGTVTHTVWAPSARVVDVMTDDAVVPMEPGPHDTFGATVAGGHGDRYRFRIDGAAILPDPMSRAQPEGVRGPSAVVDPSTFTWTDDSWTGLTLDDLVLYELHVGTFTPAGTFDAVRARLDELRDLGVTAIELMPVGTFPGRHGWGYDGLYPSAPHPAYGGPAASRRPRGRRPRRRSRGRPRRGLQPPRPGFGGDHRVRAVHRPGPPDVLGPGDGVPAPRRPRVGDPERRALGSRLPRRRPPARRGARHRRRVHAAHRGRARCPGPGPTRHDVGDRRDGDRRRAADPRVGVRRAMG